MGIKVTIANEDNYRKELFNHYDSILNGRIMSINPYTANDSDIISFTSLYDENESYINNCCSWLEIGEIGESNYNGNDYKFINLLNKGKVVKRINFSQFRYKMSANSYNDDFFTFHPEEAKYVCSIDGKKIEPETFFYRNKGNKLLYIYSFGAITAFNKFKRCYYFAFNNISASFIRKYIHKTQMLVLEECIINPQTDIPTTTIKAEIDSNKKVAPKFTYNVGGGMIDEFAINYFKSEFEEKYKAKLNELKTQSITMV